MIGLWVFLRRTYIGTAIRAVSQDREAMALMGANPQRVYFVTSAVGGAMAGLAGALLIIQYSVHPFFGAAFGPLTFMICVLGGLGNMVGAFVASFIMSEIISIGGVVISTEMGYVIATPPIEMISLMMNEATKAPTIDRKSTRLNSSH